MFTRSITRYLVVTRTSTSSTNTNSNIFFTFQAGIIKFMKTRYGVASTELFTLADTEEFLKAKEPTIFGFFEKDSDIETFFFKYAEHFTGDYRFGHSRADEVFSKYNEK